MKKILLSLALALPFWASAQVNDPEPITTYTLADRTGWTATASSTQSNDGGGPAALLDNVAGTFWHSQYDPSQLPPYTIVIDMKASKSLVGFMLQNRQSNANTNAKDIEILTSPDNITYTSQVVSTGLPQTTAPQYFDFPSTVSAQYVKLVINNSYSGSYAALGELSAYTAKTVDNTAWSRSTWTATSDSEQTGYSTTNLFDNNENTFWHSRYGGGTGNSSVFDVDEGNNVRSSSVGGINIDIDMKSVKQINKFSFTNRVAQANRTPHTVEIYQSSDGNAYNLVGSYVNTATNVESPAQIAFPLGTTISTQYLRFKIVKINTTNNGDPNLPLAEIRMFYNQILPVELSSFTAKTAGSSVNLAWSTASEVNASHFNVTRSTDGVNFTTLAKVDAAGNSTSTKNYRFVDATPNAGTNYYQLQQVDLDGKVSPSKVVSASLALSSAALVVKSVSASSVTLAVSGINTGKGTLTASNALGQTIASQAVDFSNGNTVTVNTGAAKGLIIFTLTSANGTVSKKIVK